MNVPSHLLPLIVLLLGCVSPAGSGQGEAPAGRDQVVVEKDPAGGGWLATWHLERPARELRFERPAEGFRGRIFEVETPGFRFERDGDVEVLRTDGEGARQIRVRFPEFDRQLSREYEFFRRFTDGGVAIYTGHLLARPGPAETGRTAVLRFRIIPPVGAAVVVGGERHEGAAEWVDASGRGTYAYVGATPPVASTDVISVIDPGLPPWLERQTREVLPRLFALYRDRLGAEPPVRPVVLFDYKPGEAGDYSNGGGTLPGLIQLGVEGRAWETESGPAMLRLLHFLAHEAAHVWNGEIAHYPGAEDAWMHEGSADAFAERALLELELIDEPGFLAYQTAALNDCRAGLLATALRPSAREGRPRMAYTCGNVIALLTEVALVPRDMDLFDIWRVLIARAGSQGGTYRAQDYAEVWRELGATDADLDALEAFLDGTMDPERLTIALLERGVGVEVEDPPPAWGQELVRDAVARLMAADCGGRIGFRTAADGFVLDGDIDCGALLPGSRIAALGGHHVTREGHLAYDHAQEACSRAVAARVTVHPDGSRMGREVEVACSARLPERADYVRITGRPVG